MGEINCENCSHGIDDGSCDGRLPKYGNTIEIATTVSTTEQNKVVARRITEEVVLKGKKDVVDAILAPTFIYHGPGGFPDMDRTAFLGFFDGWRLAFPDASIKFEDVLAEGDKVTIRFTTSATHKAIFNGIPATGKKVQVHGILIRRVANGKVVEEWDSTDLLGMMKQLGVIPDQPPPAK